MSIFAFIRPYHLLTFKKKVTFRQLFSRPDPYDPYVMGCWGGVKSYSYENQQQLEFCRG